MTQVRVRPLVATIVMRLVFAVSGWSQASARNNQLIQNVGGGEYDASCSVKYEGGERMRCFDCVRKVWNGRDWRWIDTCSK